MKMGYSYDEVLKMSKTFPAIYGLNLESLGEKIDFYNSIGLHKMTVDDSRQLMQSTRLSYARYMFYKEHGLVIDMETYKKLFIGEQRFEKAYGISNEELLERYNYSEFMEKSHGRIN